MSNDNSAPVIQIFDPHIHVFDRQKGQYKWLNPKLPPFWPDKHLINRNVSLDELCLQHPMHLMGVCHIEAGFDNAQPHKELAWLEAQALHANPRQLTITAAAFVDMQQHPTAFLDAIVKLQQYANFCAVRHIFEEETMHLCAHANVLNNLQILQAKGLHFELQFNMADKQEVDAVEKLLTAAKLPKVVLTHAGFAQPCNSQSFALWQQHCLQLSKLDNTYIKCSGFELVNRQYNKQDMQTVIAACVACFGEERVMCASNFPLCLFSVSYQQYWANIIEVINTLSLSLHRLCFKNAAVLYGHKHSG